MQGKNMLYSYSVAAAIVRIQRRAAVSTADTCMGYPVMPLTASLPNRSPTQIFTQD